MPSLRQRFLRGLVIPAHPLALTPRRRLDERRQRALTRYYLEAGAGGLALGVHTTQFAIRDPRVGLYRPVLELAAETSREHPRRPVLVAGVIGRTVQAVREAGVARDLGYDCALVSLAAMPSATNAQLLAHLRAVMEVLPVMGFYLQPAVGGRPLDYDFWRGFAELRDVVAIKISPFDRYATQAVIRAVLDAGREREIALYTGNDDHLILDLLTRTTAGRRSARMVGGLLGHWAFWTRQAVAQHRVCRAASRRARVPARLLTLAAEVTDANAAIFDVAHGFAGCIPGIHEILRRQGLLRGRWCLDPREELSAGQAREIDRVCAAYPHLADDDFVRERLDRWLS